MIFRMALSPIGNGAGETVAGPAQCEPAAAPSAVPLSAALLSALPPAGTPEPAPADRPSPEPVPAPPAVARVAAARRLAARPVTVGGAAAGDLLEAIRRGLVPVDPVARLLAGWPAPPVRAVAVARSAPAAQTAVEREPEREPA